MDKDINYLTNLEGVKITESDFFQEVERDLLGSEFKTKFAAIDAKRALDWAYLSSRVVGYD